MKTRVVRYWRDYDWAFEVQEYGARDKDPTLFRVPFGTGFEVIPAGTERWWWVAGGLSHDKATEVARSLASGDAYDLTDVVAEFEE